MKTDNVKLLGRTYLLNGTLWFSFSGTGVEFCFKGKKCSFLLCSDSIYNEETHQARFAVYVNNNLVVDDVLDCPMKEVNVIDSDVETEAVIKLIKLSESSDSTMGIKEICCEESAVISPTEVKNLKIEFIGDSITCGYGVDGTLEDTYSTHNENVTKAYAYLTAQALDADYSMVSFSGHGIISGYTDNGEKVAHQLVPAYYTKLGNSYGVFEGNIAPKEIGWDFAKFRPDIVVINLGTNDTSYARDNEERCMEYVQEYCNFLGTVRNYNPTAAIVCVLGLMGQELCPYVEKTVALYKEKTGDGNVYAFKLSEQIQENGVVVDYHPTYDSHKKASEEVVTFIQKEIMK